MQPQLNERGSRKQARVVLFTNRIFLWERVRVLPHARTQVTVKRERALARKRRRDLAHVDFLTNLNAAGMWKETKSATVVMTATILVVAIAIAQSRVMSSVLLKTL